MKPVSMRWTGLALALGLALIVTTDAQAYKPKPKHKPKTTRARAFTGAENGLIGIKLYDSGLRVLDVYGTPDQIEALSGGSMSSGGGGGASGGFPGGPGGMGAPGGPGGRGMGGRGKGGGGSANSAANQMSDPFSFGDVVLNQKAGGMGAGAGPQAPPPGFGPGMPGQGGGGNAGAPGAFPGAGGMGGPGMAGAGGPGGAGVPGGGGGSADRVTFTRWVYNREGSKYGFIIDKSGRVVQIEAVGLDNNRVKTKRGVGFGATFMTVMKGYQQPDGYEIAGDNLTIKYLVHDNVAFRLTRLGTKKPQVVTGIVVAAGKS